MSKHFKSQTLIKIKSINNNLPYFWQATSHQVEGEQVSGTSKLPPSPALPPDRAACENSIKI